MIRRHGGVLRSLLMGVDGALAIAMSLILYQSLAHPGTEVVSFLDAFWVRALFYGSAWVVLLYVNGAYRLRAHWTVGGEVRSVARATFWLSLLGIVALALSASDRDASGWVLLLFPLQGVLAIALRVAVRWLFTHFRRRGHNVRFLLILGTGDDATGFARVVSEHSMLGVKVVGYLGDDAPVGVPAEQHWGVFADFPEILRTRVVDEVAICVAEEELPLVEPLAQLAHEEGKVIRVPLNVPRLLVSDRVIEDLDGLAVLSYSSGPDELVGHALKRSFDVGASAVGLIVLSPLLLGVAAVLRFRQGPGVIFRQVRVGLHGRPFTIYKFRTMVADAEVRYAELADRSYTLGAAFKMLDDPRVTPAGRWLRRYSLDELPQLLNVLTGEMSIVGPRPAPSREVQEYDIWHRRRLSMKPGITGLWQVTSRLDQDFDHRAELDLAYIDRWSIWLDMRIVLQTILVVMRNPGH